MAMSAGDWLAQLQALLPSGLAWPRDPDATLTAVLRGWAVELAQVELDAKTHLDALLPDSAQTTYLVDWERVLGVYGREAVLAQLAARGGADKAYFIALASRLGRTVTQIQDNLVGKRGGMFANSPCNNGLHQFNDAFLWRVTLEGAGPAPALEALFKRLKPAHTAVEFIYLG